jgi:phage gpG-like protein
MARFSILRDKPTGELDQVKIDFGPLGAALEKVGNAGAEVLAQAAPIIADNLVFHVQEVFEREGAVAGHPRWPGLAESTKKARRGQSYVILQNTGVLAGSITPYSEGPIAEAFTNVPYAGYHVSQAPRHKLPLRDFTDIDFEQAQKEAADIILAQLDANIQRGAA